jgi:hypothetical protein
MRHALPVLSALLVISSYTHASAGPVTASSELKGTTTVTISNPSATQSAQLVYTLRDSHIVLNASSTGAASASASQSSLFQRVDQPQTLLSSSNSVTAPPNGSSSTPPLSPLVFTFSVSPNGQLVIASTSDAIAMASASEPTGAARADVSIVGFQDFFNNSSVPLSFTSTSSDSAYTLSVSGADDPNETGLAALSFGPFFSDSLTTDGVRTVPTPFTQTLTLQPTATLTVGGTAEFLQAVAAIPEPASLALVGSGVIILLGINRRRGKRELKRELR